MPSVLYRHPKIVDTAGRIDNSARSTEQKQHKRVLATRLARKKAAKAALFLALANLNAQTRATLIPALRQIQMWAIRPADAQASRI